MGEQKVSLVKDEMAMQQFVKKLLRDVQALEYMLENDWFESDIARIARPINEALDQLEYEVGDVDVYVARKLLIPRERLADWSA